MSTERLPFGFNSLIPETYKSKAEAFAKCLQHKLLSLGRIDSSSNSYGGESRIRLNTEKDEDREAESRCTEKNLGDQEGRGRREEGCPEGRTSGSSSGQKTEKAEESDEEFCSHSESENSDLSEQRKQKLISMSSEDSTVESWGSCQENLTDFEKFDSENEEVNNFASQIRGSPKLRSYNIRSKRKELREKSWKRNSRRNHSSSTESVDSEGLKQNASRQAENVDPEFNPQYILFDGLEPEGEEVPHRVLRESSSTSNLERHFSYREDPLELSRTCPQKKKKDCEEPSPGIDPDLLTPPPSPNLQTKIPRFQEVDQNPPAEDLNNRLHYAKMETDLEEVEFDEVEYLKDFTTDGISKSGKKVGEVIVECPSENVRTDFEFPSECETIVVTSVDVIESKTSEEEQKDCTTQDSVGEVGEGAEVHLRDSEEKTSQVTEDEILNSHSKMRRCSSLKTWKTPPGTPGAKKIVRFADALGLDLADVRTFLDEIPRVPSSAYEDLHFELPKSDRLSPPPPTPTLIPLFQQPSNTIDFFEKVQNQKICLETAIVTDTGFLTVTGFIRVQNMSFHKSVHVRYSLNNWETFADLQANYVPNSCDGFSDKFSFVLFGHTLKIGQKLEFALRLDCSGAQYWDNNGGINYVFNCLPQTSASSFFSSLGDSHVDPWLEFY